MKRVYVVGTADTKGEELAFLAARIGAAGATPLLIDVGTRLPMVAVDVPATEVASHHPDGARIVLGSTDRGTAVPAMAEAFARFITTRDDIAGIVGIGGGGGTSIVTTGMQKLPIGLPKLMVSTLASGDVAPYVGVADIVMMPAVTDLAGLNRLSRVILSNAANAIAAMARNPVAASGDKPGIGLTMFGVTTPCVTRIASLLGADYETFVFHATGTGGRTMEALVDNGMLTGVIDITTTEIPDLLFGGVLPAKPERLDAMARRGTPYVGSVGALDMINFFAPGTVPERFRDRLFYHHNANVTLMRTTPEENRQVGAWLAAKINALTGPVRILIPEQGVSALDIEGGAFFNPEADDALFTALETGVHWSSGKKLITLPLHINDPAFADAAAAAFRDIAE